MNDATYTGLATGADAGSGSGTLATTGGRRSSMSREPLRSSALASSETAMMLAAITENVAAEKMR
jgi:hypothetical protein